MSKFVWEDGDITPTVGSSVKFEHQGEDWSGVVIREIVNARTGNSYVLIPIDEKLLKKPEGPFSERVDGYGGYVAIMHGDNLTLGGDF